MNMDIFKKIVDDRAAERETHLSEYWALLGTIDPQHPSESDTERLAEIAEKLGKPLSQAHADHQLVLEAKRKLPISQTVADKLKEVEAATARHSEVCAQRQQTFQAMNRKVTVAYMAMEQAEADLQHARDLRGEMDRLKIANPQLYKAVSEPAPKKARR